jgi:anti-anti-sigma regulatory factor
LSKDSIEILPGGAAMLKLPPVLDLTCAETFRAELCEALALGGGLVLDAAAVERIGTPGLQLVLAAARAAPNLTIEAPSDAFRDAVADLGLGAELPI